MSLEDPYLLHHLIFKNLTVFSSCPPQDAVSLVKMEEDPEAAARKLTETAFGRGGGDNITCVVVKFQHDKTGGDSPSSPPGDKI